MRTRASAQAVLLQAGSAGDVRSVAMGDRALRGVVRRNLSDGAWTDSQPSEARPAPARPQTGCPGGRAHVGSPAYPCCVRPVRDPSRPTRFCRQGLRDLRDAPVFAEAPLTQSSGGARRRWEQTPAVLPLRIPPSSPSPPERSLEKNSTLFRTQS